jgi:hypothetical protein
MSSAVGVDLESPVTRVARHDPHIYSVIDVLSEALH